jgi:tetratricopeptide (TPR) repeat protein
LSPADLVDQREIVATVNGLLFNGRTEEALEVASAAIEARPENGWAYVARADARLHVGDVDAASADLLRAAQLEQFPDAHLLRRARAALATGDRYGSMAHVRKLLQLYPFGGEFLWFYALLIEEPDEADTFRRDMSDAMARLHPQRRPVDFLVAAHHALGDQEQALALMREGVETQCAPIEDDASLDNCLAWFYSLAGVHGDEALMRIERALERTGDRPDYLDTKAMVHLARREFPQAHQAALAAARMSPDDVYMLWQAERLGEMVDDTVTPNEDG